jgi:hypothetical protein
VSKNHGGSEQQPQRTRASTAAATAAATAGAATAIAMDKQQWRGDSDAMELQLLEPKCVLKFGLVLFMLSHLSLYLGMGPY